MPELCGNAVLYFDPEDISAITECMLKIATDKKLYDQLVTAGAEQVNKYNWGVCAKQHLSVIDKMIEI